LHPVSSIRRFLADISIPRKLAIMIGLFCSILFVILVLSFSGLAILSSVRAYIGGEGLWSKAQKQAVMKLGRYAWSHDEKEYNSYLDVLKIPLGDKQARLELEKTNPEYLAAQTGFLRGGNHPKDIPGMIVLFRRYHRVSYLRTAIAIWTEADGLIENLQKVGVQIHTLMHTPHPSPVRLEKLLIQVQDINTQLTPLENAFSAVLGEGVRKMQEILVTSMVLVATGLLAAALFIAFVISRHLCDEIDQLRDGAARIASGDYSITLNVSSKDEIGDLSRMFQKMAEQRQEAERQKDQLLINVSAANKELEAFSYSVSHDLRAPLRAIEGFSREVIANCESSLDARSKSDLQRIRFAAQRMAQLIDDLLEFSHISRSQLSRQTVDVSAQVEDIIGSLRASEPARTVDCKIAPHLVAEGDPRLLQIALTNLVQNAWKFTQKQPRPIIEFGTVAQNGNHPFYVRDNGVGFNMDYSGKLFKPFQRLHDIKDFPGTGIGLAIVQRIIERHGGRIWTEAEENNGAVFYFTLS